MVDVENEVFTAVSTLLRAQFSGIFVSGEYVAAPSTFPAVTLVEMDNSIYTFTKDLDGNENHSILLYEANVYSNLAAGKKAQSKSIISVIDSKMNELGFGRIMCQPIDNAADTSTYRMVARYRAVVSKDKQIKKII